MLPTIIKQKLATLRRREKLLRLIWGAARLLALVVGLVLLACLTDFVIDRFVDTSREVHLALLSTLIAGSVLGGIFFFWPLLQRLDDRELSLWVEDRTPALEHRLISAVQFNEEGAEVAGMSVELVTLVTEEAEQHVRKVPVARVADHGRLNKSLLTLAPAVLAVALPALFLPQLSQILLSRLFLDTVDIPRRVSSIEHVGRAANPKGENVTITVKAVGALPTDTARIIVDREGVRDSVELEIVKETLPLKIPVLAERADALARKVAETRKQLAMVQTRQKAANQAAAKATDLVARTEDPDKRQALQADLEKLENDRKALEDRAEQLGMELKKTLFKEQETLGNDIGDHARELAEFGKARPNTSMGRARKELGLAAIELDRDNAAPTLKAAHKHLEAAQTILSKATLKLDVGDVLALRLPVPSDGDLSWVIAKNDALLVPEETPEITRNEQGPDTWSLHVHVAEAGTGELKLSLQKKDGGNPVRSFSVSVRATGRNFIFYKAEVKPPAAADMLTYKAYVGDGRMKNDFEIEFRPRPVADIKAYTILPNYCQLSPQGNRYQVEQPRGEVSGLKGSSVRIVGTVRNKVASARLKVFKKEDAASDDPWQSRETLMESLEMKIFPRKASIKMEVLPGSQEFWGSDGQWLAKGLKHDAFKIGTRVSFVPIPLEDGKVLLYKIRLLEQGRAPLKDNETLAEFLARMTAFDANEDRQLTREEITDPVILALFDDWIDLNKDGVASSVELEAFYNLEKEKDGPHQGEITQLDAAAGRLTVRRTKGPTLVEAKFDLHPRMTAYSVEVTDVHEFKNDPIPRFTVKEIDEAAPEVTLLREEFPAFKRIIEQYTKKKLTSADESGLFDGVPVPLGASFPFAYSFSSPYGVDKARLRYRIRKKSLGGNESTNSDSLGLALDDADGAAKVRLILPKSPADKAGIKIDDLITHVNGAKVSDVEFLIKTVKQANPGDEVLLKIQRDGEPVTAKVTLGAAADLGWKNVNLSPEVQYDGKKGRFDPEKGCFEHSGEKDKIPFVALPSAGPDLITRRFGGGRSFLETKGLLGGIQEGDQLDFFIEVFPAANPKAKDSPPRPVGQSAMRTKLIDKEFLEQLLANEREISRLTELQRDVFPDPPGQEPKSDDKKKGP